MSNQTQYRYDVYISYNEADADWVLDWLLPRVKDAGLQVAIDEETFRFGVPVVEEIERAIRESRHILAILSPAYVSGDWDNFESQLVQHQDPGARLRRLIPLLFQECDPPDRIELLHWVDMTDPERREQQLQRVVQAVRGQEALPELHYERIPDARQRWWELRWFAFTGLAALLTVALLGWWIWSQRGPVQMDRAFNIAVAEIGEITASGSVRHSDLGALLSRWIFNGLRDQNEQYEDKSSVLVWHDSLPWTEKGEMLGRIEGETAEDRAEAADRLAQDINAHAIIYGHLFGENPRQLTVEFYVPRRLGSESNLTIGRYQFGEPLPIPSNFDPGDTLAAGALEERVTVRANALYWLQLGVRQDLLGRHAEALAIFQRAEQELPHWQERGEGKENLYFFMGREYLYLQQYAEAEAALQKALELQPNFARARIALAGVHFRRAQALSPAERLSQPDLAQALSDYEKGIELAQRADDPVLADIARLALASAFRLQVEAEYALGQYEDAVATHDRAILFLESTIERLSAVEQYRLLGQAYQFLGLSLMEQGQALEQIDSLAEGRSSYERAVVAFDACVAQQANILEDEFFSTEVIPFCQDWKTTTETILAEIGG